MERGRLDEAIRLCEERRTRPGNGVGDRIVLGRAYLAGGEGDHRTGRDPEIDNLASAR